ncbi:MAG TPA: isocitrate lyase/phosphoenolpyruvate mutase family protein, partial [Candidatus Baltobacteraceae bacterium]|nr:isocitrate lyase/phosphoenolpyruvate mutase family protein [Candidatus Baltobacteraceae bacterium]
MSFADDFFALHERGATFILPNAWDAASARLFEVEGFRAVATSSAGLANALGYADGEHVYVDELFAAIGRISRVLGVPLSADLEAGFGDSPEAVVATVERAAAAGAVGANIEDYDPVTGELIPLAAQCERIRAVKARLQELRLRFFINARSDIFLQHVGSEATRFERTVERLRAFAGAGADGVFAPGVSDLSTIAKLAGEVEAPLNVLAGPETPPLSELRRAGVTRVSVGSWPMRRSLGLVREIARELRDKGTFTFTNGPALSYDEAN